MIKSFPILCLSIVSTLLPPVLPEVQAQTRYDVFPLNKDRTWLYSYQYRYSDRELVYLVSSQLDSGTVKYTLVGSTAQADTAILWNVRQQEHLLHNRFDLGLQLDTTFWTDRDTLISLLELTNGMHELICTSLVWSYPLAHPQQAVFRFDDSSAIAYSRQDTTVYTPNFSADSLAFDTARGFYYRYSLSQFGVNTRQIYWLQIALISTSTFVAQNASQTPLPSYFELLPNCPNPFNPSTTITYELSSQAYVTLDIFDELGRLVAVLYSGQQFAGRHTVTWSPRAISSGIYFVTLRVGERSETRKIVLLQ